MKLILFFCDINRLEMIFTFSSFLLSVASHLLGNLVLENYSSSWELWRLARGGLLASYVRGRQGGNYCWTTGHEELAAPEHNWQHRGLVIMRSQHSQTTSLLFRNHEPLNCADNELTQNNVLVERNVGSWFVVCCMFKLLLFAWIIFILIVSNV